MIWSPIALGEVSELVYGRALRGYVDDQDNEHSVRVFGTNGPIGWAKAPLTDQPTVIVGRKGAYRGIHFSEIPSWTIDTAFYTKVDSNRVDIKWFYYRLLLVDINGMNSGAAIPSTRREDFYSLRLPIPDLPSQKRMVSILSDYDDLIENNRRRIALLDETAQMLYREWFVHFRFPGHEHIKIIDGLPDGWERTTLGQVADTNRESYGTKELPERINYIDISSVTQGRVVSKTTLSSNEAPGRARRKARDGDVIWSNVRPNLRAHALVLQPEEADVFSTGFTVLSGKCVPFSWLYLFVTTDHFVGHLVNHATGAGYPAVRPDDFKRAVVVLPPEELLKNFHEAAEPNFRLISKLEQQNQQLARARDLLLPRLMSGEIAV